MPNVGIQKIQGGPYSYRPMGYQQITATNVAQNLTFPANSTMAVISVSGGNIRYRDDVRWNPGSPPTASLGVMISSGQEFAYQGSLEDFQFVLSSGTPVLDILYYM